MTGGEQQAADLAGQAASSSAAASPTAVATADEGRSAAGGPGSTVQGPPSTVQGGEDVVEDGVPAHRVLGRSPPGIRLVPGSERTHLPSAPCDGPHAALMLTGPMRPTC